MTTDRSTAPEVVREAQTRIEDAWLENGLTFVVANNYVQPVEWLSRAAIFSLLQKPDLLRRLAEHERPMTGAHHG